VPDSERFAERMGALGVGEDTYVVVYDQYDPARGPENYQLWAPRLWWHLRLEGFDDVAVLDGGLGLWKAEGRPTTSEPSSYPPAEFNAQRREHLLADADEVAAGIEDDDVVIINALTPDRYAEGRIPETHNVSFTLIVDPSTGRMRSEEELRKHFHPTGALHRHRKAITYCGGGIAACVGALALARLGRDDVAVYDGSMTDWTSDPERPIASG
jgi:thiosulfate/3-mercaptopyruvate sulfurtransferase